jgi:hypothetical protein
MLEVPPFGSTHKLTLLFSLFEQHVTYHYHIIKLSMMRLSGSSRQQPEVTPVVPFKN